ncbi:MAG: PCRF domain-containing protein, partial [Candidatus Omnitrophica bacterium]|nr:PCRF domain-containing protein [Candidatus Omnitrophota bacterium]
MAEPGFWKDENSSSKIISELKELKNSVEPWQKAYEKFKELKEWIDILKEDDTINQDIERQIDSLWKDLEILERRILLADEFDSYNAILSINAGAGGTESCDWAGMLFRMYVRFTEKKGFITKVTDILSGEEAGIKNVTLIVEGEYAYGLLKGERGVHRLVRI